MLRKFITNLMVLAIAFTVTTTANAGGGDYTFTVTDGAGSTGDDVTLAALLDNIGADVQGWSMGVCHPTDLLTINGATSGADTATSNEGGTPDFDQISVYSTGATQGVVLCFTGCAVIGIVSDFEMMTMDYTITGADDATVCFCDSEGTPPVATVVVSEGASIPPAQNCGTVDVINPNQFTASSSTAVLGDAAGTTVSLVNVTMPAIDAVQVNVSYDGSVAMLTGVTPMFAFEFFAVQDPTTTPGAIVFGGLADTGGDGTLDNQIPADATTALFSVDWLTTAEGSMDTGFVDGAGNPPQDNAVWAGQGFLSQPTLVGGTLTVVNFNSFLRSDCNGDDIVNIADGIFGINWLFDSSSSNVPTCEDACDSNDDGFIDASDCIFIFNYRFLDGPEPMAPFPAAGLDPTTGDGVGCDGDADDL